MMALQITKEVGERLPPEQLALRKGIWGCTHAHILDQSACKDAEKSGKELHMLWVDMAKAYDSVSHGAVRWIMAKWGVSSLIRNTLSTLINLQTIRYGNMQNGKLITSRPLQIRNGLMQGDALSPLLFCMVISPISHWLRHNVLPYETKTGSGPSSDGPLRLGHIFYMDDLKVYTSRWDQVVKAKEGIQKVAQQLGLVMNPAKCAVKSLNSLQQGPPQPELREIPVLAATQFYKYLGIEQNLFSNIEEMWARAEESALATTKIIMDSELTVHQKIMGYNQTVIPKMKYVVSCIIFGSGRFVSLKKHARELDNKVRKQLVESHLRFGHSCVARLYVKREKGGLGLKSVEEEVEHAIVYTWCYFASNPDFIVPYQLAESLRSRNKRSLTSDFQAVLAAHGLEECVTRTILTNIKIDSHEYTSATKAARELVKKIHEQWTEGHLQEWKNKSTASRILQPADDGSSQLSLKDSFIWMVKGKVSSEVMRNVMAVQEGSLLTRCSPANRAIHPVMEWCRMGCHVRETPEHIVSTCEFWRTNIMMERHDEVARVIYNSILKKYDLLRSRQSSINETQVIDVGGIVIHWNDTIRTSENIPHNKPDILVWDKKTERIWIIEIAVSWYTRIHIQEERKLKKYSVNGTLPSDTEPWMYHPGPNLKAALQKDRKCRVDIVPLVIGTCGECSPNLRYQINALGLPDKTETLIEKMARSAVQGTNRLIKCHLSN
ncbi:hypothetical protein Y032_1211g3758 [Ancylostoma ceylanicum]|uniref:Reverse transcriptase domain-containing protein n=1 Tax=Ancylostoma ceylanicum TaxID=53326 RepID=A0A016W6S5_9BILA|nr:hypothetical protein Y032_1211g3758 [Ancylostoma ceylanicum]